MEIITRDEEKKLPKKREKKEKRKKRLAVLFSQSDAENYIAKSNKASRFIGAGVWLILAGVSAILFMGSMGIAVLFVAIAIAVMMFIFSGSQMGEFEELEDKELPIRLDMQTYQMIESRRLQLYPRNLLKIGLGVALILIPVGGIAAFGINPGFLLFFIGIAVYLFVTSGGSMSTFDHILSKGEYEEYAPGKIVASTSQALEQNDAAIPQLSTGVPTADTATTNITTASTTSVPENNVTSSNAEAEEIRRTGNDFISELYKAKNLINNPETLKDIDEIIDLTNKIIYRLQKEPHLISSTRRIFDYYLPTTVKLVVNYAEVKKQDISGENINSMISKIEEALNNLTVAYKSQLEKLYLHTSVDLEAEISTLQSMLKKEGLLADDINDIATFMNEQNEKE